MLCIIVTVPHHVNMLKFLIGNNSNTPNIFVDIPYIFCLMNYFSKGIIFITVLNYTIAIHYTNNRSEEINLRMYRLHSYSFYDWLPLYLTVHFTLLHQNYSIEVILWQNSKQQPDPDQMSSQSILYHLLKSNNFKKYNCAASIIHILVLFTSATISAPKRPYGSTRYS